MAPSMESIDRKIELLLAGQASADLQFKEFRDLFAANHARVTAVETQMTEMANEIKSLKESVNFREQQVRSLSIRIVGLPNSEDEATPKLVYDRVIKPLLIVAKERNLIPTVPQLSTAILEAYRIRPRGGAVASGSHPIRLKLASPALKTAIFKVKKDATPHPTDAEKSAGYKRILIAEELTTPTYDFLRSFREDSRVDRAWTVEGRVKYVKSGDSSVRTVRSIFDTFNYILR